MTTLSDQQIAQFAYNAGFRNTAISRDLTIAVAVALAESKGVTNATNRNTDARKTTDLGVWQINNYWHSDLIAKGNWSDPASNAAMAYTIKTTRGGWSQWTTFKTGSYFAFMARAEKAASAVQSGTIPTMGPGPNDPAANMDGDSSDGNSGLKALTNPHSYLRLGMIITGAAFILVALVMLGWSNAPQTVKTAAKAVVLKKVPLK